MREREEVSEEKKELTVKQRDLLFFVFQFRFVTAADTAIRFNQVHPSGIWVRLEKLVAMGLLAKRYGGNYKIHGRAAEYYVTPAARYELRKISTKYEREIKQLYGRVDASDRLVQRSVAILRIRNDLDRQHNGRLSFFTKPLINQEAFDYVPHPLPDAWIILDNGSKKRRDFFLDYYDDAVSIGIHARRLRDYNRYQEEGEWDDTGLPFPTILAVCQSPALAKRFSRRVRHFIDAEPSDIQVLVISMPELAASQKLNDAIWVYPPDNDTTRVKVTYQE